MCVIKITIAKHHRKNVWKKINRTITHIWTCLIQNWSNKWGVSKTRVGIHLGINILSREVSQEAIGQKEEKWFQLAEVRDNYKTIALSPGTREGIQVNHQRPAPIMKWAIQILVSLSLLSFYSHLTLCNPAFPPLPYSFLKQGCSNTYFPWLPFLKYPTVTD